LLAVGRVDDGLRIGPGIGVKLDAKQEPIHAPVITELSADDRAVRLGARKIGRSTGALS